MDAAVYLWCLWAFYSLGESRKDRKLEYINKDPKDGELYLERIKSGETLMEVRSDTNVQIVRHI